MKIIGLTGYIGSGKSTVSKMFKKNGFYYFDSDSYVAKLNSNKEVIAQIQKQFPKSVVAGKLDKKILKEVLFADYEKNITVLEKIYFPYVIRKVKRLILIYKFLGRKFLLLEVPLLFESKINELCDILVLVKCSRDTQIKRVMSRSPMPMDDLEKIMVKQSRADYENKPFNYIIDTDTPMESLEKKIIEVIKEIKGE
ncbi:MAG: dephospho-CoA kinase [Alphaproteobacteria bacterium]|jgi:dephospho-CoA kinase|nr:dephospho-CoA kinase [Alphaproteobacteria bacterium]